MAEAQNEGCMWGCKDEDHIQVPQRMDTFPCTNVAKFLNFESNMQHSKLSSSFQASWLSVKIRKDHSIFKFYEASIKGSSSTELLLGCKFPQQRQLFIFPIVIFFTQMHQSHLANRVIVRWLLDASISFQKQRNTVTFFWNWVLPLKALLLNKGIISLVSKPCAM